PAKNPTAHAAGNNAKGSTAKGKRRFDILSLVTAVVALLVSGLSLVLTYWSGSDTSQVEQIKTENEAFNGLSDLQNEFPLMTHLFVYTPEQYDLHSQQIREITSSETSVERAKLLLQEQAVANSIFTAFEGTFFYWQFANKGFLYGDRKESLQR